MKMVYKVCLLAGGLLYSSNIRPGNRGFDDGILSLRYALGVETVPKAGMLFGFEDRDLAIKFAMLDGEVVLQCQAPSSIHGYGGYRNTKMIGDSATQEWLQDVWRTMDMDIPPFFKERCSFQA